MQSEQQLPIYLEWSYFSIDETEQQMEFHLVYQGELTSSGNRNKHTPLKDSIRLYLSNQLENVWKTKKPLTFLTKQIPKLAERFPFNEKHYVPMIQKEVGLSCALDILLLRGDLGGPIVSGDLDGRIKTLIDALRLPVLGESVSHGGAPLVYCLLEDDKLVSEIKVTADHLFATPEQVIECPKTNLSGGLKDIPRHVLVLIHVKIKGEFSVPASLLDKRN